MGLKLAGSDTGVNLLGYAGELGINLLFASGVLVLWLIIGRLKRRYDWPATIPVVAANLLLAASFSLAILYFKMLGIALIGLFLRPSKLDGFIDRIIIWALRIAAVLLGFLLVEGINIWAGLALGAIAYAAQIIVGFLLTRGLARKDR